MTTTRSVVIERGLPHPPQKVWRALTEGPLLKQWLLDNDFAPEIGHNFTFRSTPVAGWNGIIACDVLVVEPNRTLAYSWSSLGLESVVTFTLTLTATGTHLRMEHSGCQPDQEAAYKGATYGWQKFLGNLEQVVDQLS
jgi:uncharacterized protein YndB with AHSA1/START domain